MGNESITDAEAKFYHAPCSAANDLRWQFRQSGENSSHYGHLNPKRNLSDVQAVQVKEIEQATNRLATWQSHWRPTYGATRPCVSRQLAMSTETERAVDVNESPV